MTDIERGTYAPLPDEPELEVEEVEEHGRGPLLLVVAMVVIVAFAGVVYVAYQQGVQAGLRQSRGTDLPMVAAEPGPIKVAPKPGDDKGFEEPFQDMRVLNGDKTEPTAETLLPPPEEPIDQSPPAKDTTIGATTPAKDTTVAARMPATEPEVLPIEPDDTPAPAEKPSDASKPIEIITGTDTPPASEPAKPAEDTVAEAAPSPSATPGAGEELKPEPFSPKPPETEPASPAPVAEAPPAPAPVAEAPASTPTPPATSAANAASGNFVVQVASVPSNDLALAKQAEISRKHGPVLTGLGFDVGKADLGNRGTFYRLRIGPFKTREDAIALCETLKGRGQDCYVTTP